VPPTSPAESSTFASKAGLAEPVQHVETGEAGPDDHRVELFWNDVQLIHGSHSLGSTALYERARPPYIGSVP
jgi:hypothetical protein